MKRFLTVFVLVATACLLAVASQAATTLTYEYDANGNMIRGDGKYYEYNDANKMVRVRQGDETGPVVAEFVYDHTGQRIKKIEDGVTTYYVGKHFEHQVGGEASGDTTYYFVNGQRIARKTPSGNTYFYHLDHLGGTNAVSDSAGNLMERTKYYPFGEIREGGSEKFTYTGKEKDKTSEFYYFEARYYHSDFRHFTQPDVIAPEFYDPQSLNRYAYVQNNPFRYIDPSGNKRLTFKDFSSAVRHKLNASTEKAKATAIEAITLSKNAAVFIISEIGEAHDSYEKMPYDISKNKEQSFGKFASGVNKVSKSIDLVLKIDDTIDYEQRADELDLLPERRNILKVARIFENIVNILGVASRTSAPGILENHPLTDEKSGLQRAYRLRDQFERFEKGSISDEEYSNNFSAN